MVGQNGRTLGCVDGLLRSLLLLLVLATAACGSAGIVGEKRPPASLRPKGIVVFPIALMQEDATALDVAARSGDVGLWLLQNTDLPVVGPQDFAVTRALDEVTSVEYDTDLLPRKEAFGTDFRDWVALHVLVTENRAVHTKDLVDERAKDKGGTGKTYRQHGVEATLRVELTLYDTVRGQRLAFTAAEARDNPADVRLSGDPRPALRSALNSALQRLQTIAGVQLQGPAGRRHRGEQLVPSIPALMAYKVADKPSWNEQMASKSADERDGRIYGLWDRFAPETAMVDILSANRNPGLLVQKPLLPLQTGDIVLQVGETPIHAAYQFDRTVRQCAETACNLKVFRKGEVIAVTLRWPTLPRAPIPEQEEE